MDALLLGTVLYLKDEMAEFTADGIFGPSEEITLLIMMSCPVVRVEVNLFCPSP